MTEKNLYAELGEACRSATGFQVGALDLITEVDQHFGNAAHAAAANTDKMDAVNTTHAIHHAASMTRTQARAKRSVESLQTRVRAWRAMVSN